MKKLLLVILVALIINVYGQKLPEPMLCSPVLLITDAGQGSGLFLSDSNYVYFVTARHNFFKFDIIKKDSKDKKDTKDDTAFQFIPKTGEFVFYPHSIINSEPSIILIDLKSCFNNGLIKFDKKQYVAVIKIANLSKVNDKYSSIEYIKQIQRNNNTNVNILPITATKTYSLVSLGGDIFLFGYPSSIGLEQTPQFDYSRTLLRKGIVAGKYERSKTIIIDCPTYYGNSGGPVFEIEGNGFNDKAFLIGICTEFVPYVDLWKNERNGSVNSQTMNSGYSVVTSIDHAIELIKEYK